MSYMSDEAFILAHWFQNNCKVVIYLPIFFIRQAQLFSACQALTTPER